MYPLINLILKKDSKFENNIRLIENILKNIKATLKIKMINNLNY